MIDYIHTVGDSRVGRVMKGYGDGCKEVAPFHLDSLYDGRSCRPEHFTIHYRPEKKRK